MSIYEYEREQWNYKPVSWESVFTTYLVEQGYEESKIGLG